MGLVQTAQLSPRDDSLHLAQKALTLRLLMVGLKTDSDESHLSNGNFADSDNQNQSDLPRSDELIRGSLT
jgi:hypothetical protein